MQVTLTIKNYRCFLQPTSIGLTNGFTAFVGVNNSGKSALMRFLLEFRPLFQRCQPGQDFFQALRTNAYLSGINFLHVEDPEEIFSNLNNKNLFFALDYTYENNDQYKHIDICPTRIEFDIRRNFSWHLSIVVGKNTLTFDDAPALQNQTQYARPNNVFDAKPLFDVMSILARTLYIGPFRNTINVGTRTDYLDIQIGEAFISQLRDLKTGSSKRNSAAISSLTEDIRRIFGFESLDFIPSTNNTSLHFTINGKPYKQHELGSGIAQFIVVLANASVKRPTYVLIDEPELNLHPSLQLDFLTSLAKFASEGIWFSTHSLGLARSAADRVYSISKISDGNSVVHPLEGTPRLSEFLGEMGFGSYKELGFTQLLLVEGPTEVKTVQMFLRLLKKDHKCVVLPMHAAWPDKSALDELLRITPNIAALIDSERGAPSADLEPRRQAFLDLCAQHNVRAHVLERRATENYFPDYAIKAAFGGAYRALQPHERLRDVNPNWSKNQNWKAASATHFEDIQETDLGKFLTEL